MADVELMAVVEDIGTGFGAPASIEYLRKGQLQKRLILLRTLVAEAQAKYPGDAELAGLALAYQSLTGLQQTRPAEVGELLMYPNTGSWLVQALQALRDHDGSDPREPLWPTLGYLGWLAASGHFATTSNGSTRVVICRGTVMLPRIGLARLAAESVSGHCELSWGSDGGLVFRNEDCLLTVSEIRSEGISGWLPLRSLADRGMGAMPITLDDVDPFRDLDDPYSTREIPTAPPRLSLEDSRQWQVWFEQARELLLRDFPGYAQPMTAGLRAVVPLTARPLLMGASNTSFHAFGCVNMSAPASGQQMALTLIHEFQHAKLAALTDLVELHEPDPRKRFYAPWRDDPRPLAGLLQGIYAHLGVTGFWRAQRHTVRAPLRAEVEFARWRTQVERAVAEVRASGLLTPAGERFVEALSSTLNPWLSESVSDEALSVAEESSVAHRVYWCVRNLRVDTAELALLQQFWAHRSPSDRELPTPQLVDQRDVPIVFRSRLPPGYLRFSASQGASAAELDDQLDGDLAFAAGDFARAYAVHSTSLRANPRDPQPWAGVALALSRQHPEKRLVVLRERAELVAQLYEQIQADGGTCDVLELVDWLSNDVDQ